MIRFHYFHQEPLADASARRWQRFHLFSPWTGRGIGVTIFRHEFSVCIPRGGAS